MNVDVSSAMVLSFLQNIKNIDRYEPKLISAEIIEAQPDKGFYKAKGTFLNFRWRGKFTYELNYQGFHSRMVGGPLSNKMQGGFAVYAISENSCCVIHYEEYQFPRWTILLKPLFRYYLKKLMIQELKTIQDLLQEKLISKKAIKNNNHENISAIVKFLTTH